MVRILKTTSPGGRITNTSEALVLLARVILDYGLGKQTVDEEGQALALPVVGNPTYVGPDATYTVRATKMTVWVGIGIDISQFATALAAIIGRIQPVDYFNNYVPVTNIVSTLMIKPTLATTEINPEKQAGRGIFYGNKIGGIMNCFYTINIRPLHEFNHNDGRMWYSTLGDIIFDVDDVFNLGHFSLPIKIEDAHYRIFAEGRMRTLARGDFPAEIVIIPDIANPAYRMVCFSDCAHNNRSVHEIDSETLKHIRRNPRHYDISCCSRCKSKIYDDLAFTKDNSSLPMCIQCSSTPIKIGEAGMSRINTGVKFSTLVKDHPMKEYIEDTIDGVEYHFICGVPVYFGKKYAYTAYHASSSDERTNTYVQFAGPAFFNHPDLQNRTICPAMIFVPRGFKLVQ